MKTSAILLIISVTISCSSVSQNQSNEIKLNTFTSFTIDTIENIKKNINKRSANFIKQQNMAIQKFTFSLLGLLKN